MGMTLSSVKLGLSKSLCSYKLTLGFSSASHVIKDVFPECIVTLDKVGSVMVYDWWHPNYPHFNIRFPWESNGRERGEDEGDPLLNKEFFALHKARHSAPSL